MSLEQALAENTEALKTLTALLQSQAQTRTAAPATTVKSAPPAKVEEAVKEKGETALTYEQVKVPFLALVSAKGRDAALAAIAPHANLKAIEGNPELYADILANITKASA